MRTDPLARVQGHTEGCALLRSMLLRGRVPNGILITGPVGCGRRTLALAFAEALLFGDAQGLVDAAEQGVRRLRQGAHPDLVLVEREGAKRQLGIDSVRALRSEFGMKPLEASRRVGLVVDADRLTEEAGNALLKLLEEPPAGSHLVLTAPGQGALMETLLSRCVRVRLGPVDSATVLQFLARAGVTGPTAALCTLAAEGAPGRALELAQSGFVEQLPAAAKLLQCEAAPFTTALALHAALEEDKKQLEETRERVRQLLRAALFLLRLRRRALEGLPWPVELSPELALESIDATSADRRSGQLLQALQLIDTNVAPPQVLTHFAMAAKVRSQP